jgi:hypothetical protein
MDPLSAPPKLRRFPRRSTQFPSGAPRARCLWVDLALVAALDERGRRGRKGVRKDACLTTGYGPRLQCYGARFNGITICPQLGSLHRTATWEHVRSAIQAYFDALLIPATTIPSLNCVLQSVARLVVKAPSSRGATGRRETPVLPDGLWRRGDPGAVERLTFPWIASSLRSSQ